MSFSGRTLTATRIFVAALLPFVAALLSPIELLLFIGEALLKLGLDLGFSADDLDGVRAWEPIFRRPRLP